MMARGQDQGEQTDGERLTGSLRIMMIADLHTTLSDTKHATF